MKHQKMNKPSVKVNSRTTECPACKSSWDGGSIFDTFCQQRENGIPYWADKSDAKIMEIMKDSYAPPYRWHRQIGIEIRGQYDGVSIWQCPDCAAEWDAFTGKLRKSDVTESVCDNCEPVSGFYLGMTCPKCNRPFRSVKQTVW